MQLTSDEFSRAGRRFSRSICRFSVPLLGQGLPALALGLVLTGCSLSPLAKHTAAFSSATNLVVDNSTNAYRAAITLHDEEQVSEGVLLFEEGKPWDPHSVQPLISEQGLNTRLQVLAALKTYAQSLSDLTSGLASPALTAAATSTGSSLQSLSAAYTANPADPNIGLSVGTQTANVVSTAALALGEFLVAQKVKKALPSITKKMDPQIEILCTVLLDDVDTLRKVSKRDNEALISQQITFLRTQGDKLPESDRRAEIEKLPAIVSSERTTDAMLADLHTAIMRLALTHHALAAEAQGNNPEALQARIADLEAAGASLGHYYQGLPTK
jgi:hypothetical protein